MGAFPVNKTRRPIASDSFRSMLLATPGREHQLWQWHLILARQKEVKGNFAYGWL
jgi:hypothetical protein